MLSPTGLNLAHTFIVGDITASTLKFGVKDLGVFNLTAPFNVFVDNELMVVTNNGQTAGQLTVTRGAKGTTAVAHSNDAVITVLDPHTLAAFSALSALGGTPGVVTAVDATVITLLADAATAITALRAQITQLRTILQSYGIVSADA